MFLPPIIFAALAATFYIGMIRDNPDDLPSTRVGQMAPALPTTALADFPLLTAADLSTGEITLVNFWASWCPPCRAEHPVLKQLSADGIRVVGVNFKDTAKDASAYLTKDGNPFLALAFDPQGRSAIDWGVTAPPETFIVGGDGKVLFRFVGPLVGSYYEQTFLPALQAALAK
ncbi:MAG: DsbE family thiol:disulfide interchange protein [Rhodoferax sp.]|nr:DsbE family thiol:disulfide interchange protein [Pseudorhodobacter sp.]